MDKGTLLNVNRQTLPTTKPIKGFAQISNAILLDQRLSFKARGILSMLLSRPDGWKIYINEITSKSDKDGKRAVQSGFKELTQFGYLKLLPVYNDETGKFEGTYYHLNKSIFLPRQPHFRTVEKQDSPESRPSEIQTDAKLDQPKTASFSNTNSSNTKNSNKKQQQHQEEPAVTVDVDSKIKKEEPKQDIIYFFPQLEKDSNWQQQFVGQELRLDFLLSEKDFPKLLLHFKQTSLKSGTAYQDLPAVKRHFSNWFNVNLTKKALSAFIAEQNKTAKKIRVSISKLIPKTDELIDTLLQRQCTDTQEVISLQERLLSHQDLYRKKLDYLFHPAEKITIQGLIADIEKITTKIDNGNKINRLDWFCQQKE